MRTHHKMPLTRTQILILGYGYARSLTPEPEFGLRQLADISAENGYRVDISNLYQPAGRLALRQYLSKTSKPAESAGAATVQYAFQKEGFEPLVNGVIYGIRWLANTIPEMLKIEESIQAMVGPGHLLNILASQLLEKPVDTLWVPPNPQHYSAR